MRATPPTAAPLDAERAATLSELERQHKRLHVAGWLTMAAIGAASLVSSIAVMVPGAMMVQTESCGDDPVEGCGHHGMGRVMVISSAVVGAMGVTLLAVSLPLLVRDAKRARALNAEIRRLRQPRASLMPTPFGVRLGFSLAF